ncbi:hypothetical protein BH09PSE5_BH09PSE5_08430 [soil metagenome]
MKRPLLQVYETGMPGQEVWGWNLRAANGRIVAKSPHRFPTREQAIRAAETFQRVAAATNTMHIATPYAQIIAEQEAKETRQP